MRQSAATNSPLLVSTSGLISSERAPTLRAAANNFRIESASSLDWAGERPHEVTASLTALSSGPLFTSQGIRRVEAARSSIPVPPPVAKIMTGARAVSSIANEKHQYRFSLL